MYSIYNLVYYSKQYHASFHYVQIELLHRIGQELARYLVRYSIRIGQLVLFKHLACYTSCCL